MATSRRLNNSPAETLSKPHFIRVSAPKGATFARVRETVRRLSLSTVCEEARCPNIAECWGGGTATVMLMGEVCTRGCKFCHVQVGAPQQLDALEPERLQKAVANLDLRYLVITSVNRDDLPDGGAAHFAFSYPSRSLQET